MGLFCSKECPPEPKITKIKAALNCANDDIDACWLKGQQASNAWKNRAYAATKSTTKQVFGKDIDNGVMDRVMNVMVTNGLPKDAATYMVWNMMNREGDPKEQQEEENNSLLEMCEANKKGALPHGAKVMGLNLYFDAVGCSS